MLNLKKELENIRNKGLYRKMPSVYTQPGPKVTVDGRELLMMASNDYLGLSSHPRIKKCATEAIEQWGAGAGAARLISGNTRLFTRLETKLASFKETENALVFSTGYMANAGLLSALADAEDALYSDALNHASIIDGCRLSPAQVEVYPHRDVDVLESLLRKSARFKQRIIVTDAVFSMDGDIAPVPDLIALAKKYDAALIIDDAHGTGVLGEKGRGTMEHFGLSGYGDIIIMGTMGKALGCFGAFVAGSTQLREFLINRARSFIFTTALPPSVPASALEALQIIEDEPQRRKQLMHNVSCMRDGLGMLGFNTLSSQTQIIPVMIGDPATAVAMTKYLFDNGLFIQAIRPPTVPEGSSRLRITLMATHTQEDIEKALGILEHAGKKFGII